MIAVATGTYGYSSDVLPGRYQQVNGCATLEVERNGSEKNSYIAMVGYDIHSPSGNCFIQMTQDYMYALTVEVSKPLYANGTLKLMGYGANGLNLGKSARFEMRVSMKDTQIVIRYLNHSGKPKVAIFTNVF